MNPKDLKIELPSISDQTIFVERMRALERIEGITKALEATKKKPASWNEFDKGYESPEADEIRETFKPYTGSQIANMLGLSDSRSVRRWIGGDVQIPYAAWRLFLILTGRVF
jgi:hypothetical protein